MEVPVIAMQQGAEKQNFTAAANRLFTEVIEPKIDELIAALTGQGLSARRGQAVERIAHSGKTLSFSVSKPGTECKLQVDFVQVELHQQIHIYHTLETMKHNRLRESFDPHSLTAQKVEYLVQRYVEAMVKGCPR